MSLYKGMGAKTLEAQYNLTQRRDANPDLENFMNVVERWLKLGVEIRATSNAQISLSYGKGEREVLDYFYSGDPNGPLLMYIHGGYWQRGDKSMYSFISESFVKQGVSVAIINYDLTPAVRIGQIPQQIRKAIAWCFHHAEDLKFNKDQFHLTGHSAGGHLTAMMMATDWPEFDKRLPTDLIKTASPISGVFELEPIVHTSLNEGPQMDIQEAIEQSPMFISPTNNVPQLVIYGGGETTEFNRQANAYADKFRTKDRAMEVYEVPHCDHFSELECLAEDDSILFKKMHTLITTQSL